MSLRRSAGRGLAERWRPPSLDHRAIHVLTFLVLAAGVLWPARWPATAGPATRRAFALAQAVQPGQSVFIVVDYGFGAQPELDPELRAVLAHLMRRGAYIVLAARTVEGAEIAQNAVRETAVQMDTAAEGGARYAGGYGTTWVNLGFRPAGDVLLRAATHDLVAAYNDADYAGARLRGMPIASRLTALDRSHFALVYIFDSADGFAALMNYVTQPTGLPLIVGAITSEVPILQPFLGSGQVAAVIPGLRGAAAYEALLGLAGGARRAQTALALAAVYVAALLVVGNVNGWLRARQV